LAEHGGPEYYFGVAGGAESFAVNEAKLQEVLGRLNACGPFDFPYDRSRFALGHPPEAEPLPEGLEEHRSTAIILGVATGLGLLAMPFGLIHVVICLCGFLAVLIFGIWLAVHISLSPWQREHRSRRRAYNLAHDALNELEEELQGKVRSYRRDHSELNRSLQALLTEWRGLAAHYQGELQRLTATAEAAARLRHLRLHLIADADIPRIGAGRKQTLAANSIFTAADVRRRAIRRIKGFGDVLTNNLLAWKEEVLRHYRFNPATALSPAEHRPVALKFRTRQQQILTEVEREMSKLETLAPTCRAALQKQIPALQQAVAAYKQAEADLHLLNAKR
jgi:DNA-binding helix-hairpin-helix protein with protein kinase domain